MISVFPLQTRCSLGAEAWSLLIVVVLDNSGVLGLLLLLGGSDTGSNLTELSLVFSIGENLEASILLSLHGEESLGFLFVLFKHFLFFKLVGSLVEDGLLLSGVQPLEVVWLHSVWGEGGLLSGWVLGHEVMGEGELFIMSGLELLLTYGSGISISLLLGHLGVGSLVGPLHLDSLSLVLGLGVLKKLAEVILLLGESIVSGSLLLLEELLLTDLLSGPVCLL